MFEKSKEAFRYGEELLNAERHAVCEVKVPKDFGVYLWRCKKDYQIVHIGRALGKGGLHQRINKEHLNENYLSEGEEKSAFRKKVAKVYKGKDIVNFIKENYTLSFITFTREEKMLANFVEQLLQFEYGLEDIPYK